MPRIPWKQIRWPNTLFFLGTLLVTLTAVPVYLWHFGLDRFQVGLFFFFWAATQLSITLGYHRLFSHRAFKASGPVRLFTMLFGAAAFEHSVLVWAADHRRHHKFVDHEEDPYDISKGFFHAHIGWILFKLQEDTPLEYANDLRQDRLIQWQHRHYYLIATLTCFALPALLGFVWGGATAAIGSLLLAGVARVVIVNHSTFFINSLCHTLGRRPYSSKCTARDSAIMAVLTMGEGYHNFHHAFQHDYRNGVKPWQWDPTKWAIWTLNQLGLAGQLRRVPIQRILLAEIAEKQRQLAVKLSAQPTRLADPIQSRLHAAQARLQQSFQHWERLEAEYGQMLQKKLEASREKLADLRREFQEAGDRVQAAIQEWHDAHRLVLAQVGSGYPA